MKCQFPNKGHKIVMAYLRKTGQTLTLSEGAFSLTRGAPEFTIIEKACRARAIFLAPNGQILVCGIEIKTEWDMERIRRRVEDHLRKSASEEEIIRIAACLGLL